MPGPRRVNGTECMSNHSSQQVAYGGQAVIEGVMMRGKREMAVAVRAPSGEIVVWSEPLRSSRLARRVRPWPFVRGAILLGDTLALGVRALMFSAAFATPGQTDQNEESVDRHDPMRGKSLWLTVATAVVFAIGLFFVLPLVATAFLDRFIESDLLSNIVEGAIRLAILLGYVLAIGRMPEIRRVFAYHGAEHKAIHAWEAGDDLTVEQVRRHPLEHPRCGTGFLLVVMLLSVVVFALLGRPELPIRIASRIVLVPLIAGVAYEFLKFGGRHASRSLTRLLLTPGLRLQRATTRQPDDGILEVAIAALLRVLVADGHVAESDPRLQNARRVDASGRPLDEIVQIGQPMALAAD
ncbi:MAG: hypothetical protein QOF01_4217 [Thermomicrobiales bacterium]|nr:hypothetical protein [Thermomicrobiales bacterium]